MWRTTAGLCSALFGYPRGQNNEKICHCQHSAVKKKKKRQKNHCRYRCIDESWFFRRLTADFDLLCHPCSPTGAAKLWQGYCTESSSIMLHLLLLFTGDLVYILEYKNSKHFSAYFWSFWWAYGINLLTVLLYLSHGELQTIVLDL